VSTGVADIMHSRLAPMAKASPNMKSPDDRDLWSRYRRGRVRFDCVVYWVSETPAALAAHRRQGIQAVVYQHNRRDVPETAKFFRVVRRQLGVL
jgi:hypothetical protein